MAASASIKVKAIAVGFRGGRRYRVGEIFRVIPGKRKATWYVPYEDPKEPELPEPVAKPARLLKPELTGEPASEPATDAPAADGGEDLTDLV